MVKGLEESLPRSSDSNDRSIGAIIAKVIKKLDAAKAKKKRLLWQLRMREVVEPLRRKSEKKGEEASTYTSLEVVVVTSTIK